MTLLAFRCIKPKMIRRWLPLLAGEVKNFYRMGWSCPALREVSLRAGGIPAPPLHRGIHLLSILHNFLD